MESKEVRHEIVFSNADIDVRFYLSADDGGYVPPHWHDHIEMIYMLEGEIQIHCETREIHVKAGELIVLNSKEIHSIWSTKNQALVLQVSDKILEKYVPDYELLQFQAVPGPMSPAEATKMERLKKICHDMYVIYEVRPDGYLLKFNSLLYDLLFSLVHSYSIKLVEKEVSRNQKNREKMKEILTFLDKHHEEQLTVQSVAEHFNYHPDYLSRIMKRQIGMTVSEYLYEIRINYIYYDLMNTADFINEIFERHGCTNYRVTMRWFKKRFGCTPKEKRKMEREKL
ncbi:AraC family transcriptional regulator [Clostridium sp. AF19-22AC]|jgi:AraC-like DNA-binding protein/mannose-6-phosphate isomerase-like protein (cupin superfamily)|uniref:AraC family transcriptional regulator n=1 Tax=Clostridia TaxID=186801 RepID=UPI000E477D21|nr:MULTISPECIES: AraC family transcriptional regulator [Clostridia]RHR25129.1 AraC family transcriptional regulator [Clostridium sp. AF19-22AC]